MRKLKIKTDDGVTVIYGSISTGAVDSEMKEIFEGDILRAKFRDQFGDMIELEKEVFYCRENSAFECKDIGINPIKSDHWNIPNTCLIINK